MSRAEIIAKAKKLYPIGTEFRWIGHNDTCILRSHRFDSSSFLSNVGEDYLYRDGVWAEIVKLPVKQNQVVLKNGDIIEEGTVVVSLKKVGGGRNIGDMFRIHKITPTRAIYYRQRTSSSDPNSFRRATLAEISKFDLGTSSIDEEMNRDRILEEAKRMYPKGTRHFGAKGGATPGEKAASHKIKNTSFIVRGELKWSIDNIYSQGQSGAIYVSGNPGAEWAFIFEEEIKQKEITNNTIPSPKIMEKTISMPAPKQRMVGIKIASITLKKKVIKRRLIN